MPIDKNLTTVHVFPSEESLNKNLGEVADNDLSFVPLNMPFGNIKEVKDVHANDVREDGMFRFIWTDPNNTHGAPSGSGWGILLVTFGGNLIIQRYVDEVTGTHWVRLYNVKYNGNTIAPIGEWSTWVRLNYVPDQDKPKFEGWYNTGMSSFICDSDMLLSARDDQGGENGIVPSISVNGLVISQDGSYHSREIGSVTGAAPKGATVTMTGRQFFAMRLR